MSDNNENIYVIPNNFKDSMVTASGMSIRNLIEGGVFAAVAGVLIYMLPIHPTKIKIMTIAFVGLALFMFGAIGIKHYSVTEFIKLFIKYKSMPQHIEPDYLFDLSEREDNKTDEDEDDEDYEEVVDDTE